MTNFQKTILIVLIVATAVYIKFAFFSAHTSVEQTEEVQEEVVQEPEQEEDVPKSYAMIYFIGQNNNNEEVYKPVKRLYDAKADGSKLSLAIKNLLDGPTSAEKAKGIYSEIPTSTKLLSLKETPEKIIIDLSAQFDQGGGTDGLYKRLYQIIKTANKNSSTPVYLYINGKKAEVIGGEGIMINQPLNEKSLDE